MDKSAIGSEEATVFIPAAHEPGTITLPEGHLMGTMSLTPHEPETNLVVVHGTRAQERAAELSLRMGIVASHYNSLAASEVATGRHILWGTLHEELDGRVTYTSLMNLLDIADEVYRDTELCETCGIDKAVLYTLEGKVSCCPCARNALQKEGPRVMLKGDLSTESLKMDNTVRATIKTTMPGMSRARTGATEVEAIRLALQALVDAEVGPKYVYSLSAPRRVASEVLDAAGKGFSVIWT